MSANGKIVDAHAEWDDRGGAFRVYLVREVERSEDGETWTERDDGTPMEAVHETGDVCETIEGRLYRAAFVRCAKDIAYHDARDRVLGWPKEAPAKRVAAAVKKELTRIEKGEPGPTADVVRLTLAFLPRKGR